MEDLRKLYSELGFTNVESYIQSGNVIFQTKEKDATKLENDISEKIKEVYGYDVPVIVLTIDELKKIIKGNPFLKRKEIDLKRVHITFLSSTPNIKLLKSIDKERYMPDEFEFSGKAVYLFIPDSYAKTKLSNNFFEKELKTKATTRNLNTANQILTIAEKVEERPKNFTEQK